MQYVKYESKGKVLNITLDRPEKRNAFDAIMIQELTACFQKAKEEKGIRVMVLRGHGKSFSAGADLGSMRSMAEVSLEENKADSEKLRQMYLSLQNVPFPVLGQVRGHVMGGALGLVALCDVALAEKSTKFCFSEVKLGLSPAVVSVFAARKIPRAFLQRYFLTAELFDGSVAESMGLVQFSGEENEVEDLLESLVEKICKNGPQAVRATKDLLESLYVDSPEILAEKTTSLIASLRVSSEGQKGLSSFFAKRSPDWES